MQMMKAVSTASEGVTFNDFIIEMAPGILLTIVPSFMLVRWLYKDEFSGRSDRDITELERQYAIKDMRGLKVSGTILCLVIIGFFLHPVYTSCSSIALAFFVIMLLATNPHELEEPREHVEWITLLFFAGLFVLVHSLQHMGVIDYIGGFVKKILKHSSRISTCSSGRHHVEFLQSASAFIDNIPYTATIHHKSSFSFS